MLREVHRPEIVKNVEKEPRRNLDIRVRKYGTESRKAGIAGVRAGQTSETRLKYQGTILKMYEDTVEVNGHQAKWDFIHHDGAAAVLPVTEDGKILMVRQYRNALDRYTLEIPAGKLDSPDEAKIDCAYRELEEETGYRCDHLEYLMSVNTTIAFCDEALDIFLARDLKKTHQHLDPDEGD